MKRLRKGQTVAEVAVIVSETLQAAGVRAVLSGGGAVSIYSKNAYESSDLDFVTSAGISQLDQVMTTLGFSRRKGRHYEHPNCEWLIEFPPGPVMLGDEIVSDWVENAVAGGVIRMLSPTQCVMDRLAAFYHWNDRQCLDQAVMVACRNRVNFSAVKRWSVREGHAKRLAEFLAAAKKASAR